MINPASHSFFYPLHVHSLKAFFPLCEIYSSHILFLGFSCIFFYIMDLYIYIYIYIFTYCVQSSCLILCGPMDCSLLDSSVYRFFQTIILEWVAISYPRGSSRPSDQTRVSCISCIGRQVLHHQCHLGSPIFTYYILFINLLRRQEYSHFPISLQNYSLPSCVVRNDFHLSSISLCMSSIQLTLSIQLLASIGNPFHHCQVFREILFNRVICLQPYKHRSKWSDLGPGS